MHFLKQDICRKLFIIRLRSSGDLFLSAEGALRAGVIRAEESLPMGFFVFLLSDGYFFFLSFYSF